MPTRNILLKINISSRKTGAYENIEKERPADSICKFCLSIAASMIIYCIKIVYGNLQKMYIIAKICIFL